MTDIKIDLIDILGIDDEGQAEMYADFLEYAKDSCQDILNGDVSEEVKIAVENEARLIDEKLSGLLDFFKHHKLSDFVYGNLRKEGLSDEDIAYTLDMLSDKTYTRFISSYNASMAVYKDIVVGLIEYNASEEGEDTSEAPTTTQLH